MGMFNLPHVVFALSNKSVGQVGHPRKISNYLKNVLQNDTVRALKRALQYFPSK